MDAGRHLQMQPDHRWLPGRRPVATRYGLEQRFRPVLRCPGHDRAVALFVVADPFRPRQDLPASHLPADRRRGGRRLGARLAAGPCARAADYVPRATRDRRGRRPGHLRRDPRHRPARDDLDRVAGSPRRGQSPAAFQAGRQRSRPRHPHHSPDPAGQAGRHRADPAGDGARGPRGQRHRRVHGRRLRAAARRAQPLDGTARTGSRAGCRCALPSAG